MKFRKNLAVSLALGLLAASVPAPGIAALPQGAGAPDFTLSAAKAGKPFNFSLHQSLRKGPVVLYFFPAAFTAGCTIEAHLFAEATDSFRKMGATVVGVTAGNVERVAEFSKLECRDKFAVAADPGAKIAAEYKTVMQFQDKTLSERTSFVIAPDGKILLSYTDRNPQAHIDQTMAAVREWKAKHS
ncbi:MULTISPECIES: peroxiredoxin [Novosphingobium]|uniref:thioredoxin-dependent peroxiredoxin n=1 Tax=Novosphingobium sediminicola TaxID=563162 RepID=A0A7W6CIW2_9SPHN|nr:MULTISPECIES: peroxiredoxin [Novosphingobium]MBB3956672.1 peroxiredoxin [Novosphingobium sediminicola]NOW46356.1 peroxiredoxin [Novosphingobium sp. SG751A]